MKLTNIIKNALAASVLTVATFSANANLIGSSVLDIENFSIVANDGDLILLSSQWTATNSANYLGNVVSDTDTNNTLGSVLMDLAYQCSGPDCAPSPIAENDYSHNLLSLGDDLDFVHSDSNVSFDFPTLSTNAQSRADVSLSSTNSDTLSRADTTITNTVNGNLVFQAQTGTSVDISYDFESEFVAMISPDWATNLHNAFVETSYSLSVSVTNLGTGVSTVISDLATALTLSTDGTFNFDFENTGTKSANVELDAGLYQIGISHSTYVSAKHVSEPTTLAIFGLGLLGLAGASRRRKS